MTDQPASPPYFDQLLAQLEAGDPTTTAAFSRHVHWGYWTDPSTADGTACDYGHAAENLCRALLEHADIQNGQRILDVGCGFGGTIASLNERFRDLDLVGVNIDARQLKRAGDRVTAANGNAIEWVQADAARLPLSDGRFEHVLAVESIFHFDRISFFAEACRVLADGGSLTLSDFVPHERAAEYLTALDPATGDAIAWAYGEIDIGWSLDRYRTLATANGFTLTVSDDVTTHTLPTYPFLDANVQQWTAPSDVAKFRRATGLLEKASRRGLLTYQILRFERTGSPTV